MLLRQAVRCAASRARFIAGNRMLTSRAIIPITTSNSTRVKALLRRIHELLRPETFPTGQRMVSGPETAFQANHIISLFPLRTGHSYVAKPICGAMMTRPFGNHRAIAAVVRVSSRAVLESHHADRVGRGNGGAAKQT